MSMRSITTWIFNLLEPVELARRFSDLEGSALLYSGGQLDSAQASFVCLFPEEKVTVAADTECWENLSAKLGAFTHGALPIPRWVGYLGYEMGCFADQDVQITCLKGGLKGGLKTSIPDSCFYRPSVVVHFDHKTGVATLYASREDYSLARISPPHKTSQLTLASHSDTLETYLRKIAQAKEWILDGEIYQVNLSQVFCLEGSSSPFDLFEQVNGLNPAPFSAFINCGAFSIVSSSPERFLSKKGTQLETRPIKGTAPRGKTTEEDQERCKELLASEKERAELLMITDLMRNDLGKVSLPGSVKVQEMWRCEAYTNVFHLIAIIEGRCQDEADPVHLVRHLFPGGSVTGCPKLRAMEAIAALEKRPRGIYTGSIGYFAHNGDFDFNIAIRTLVADSNQVYVQLGGAIGIDSNPTREFEETLHKGHSLFTILGIVL